MLETPNSARRDHVPFSVIWSTGSTGVEDLQEENCKLGVYNAEKGERGILSLQVGTTGSAWPSPHNACQQQLAHKPAPPSASPPFIAAFLQARFVPPSLFRLSYQCFLTAASTDNHSQKSADVLKH